MNGKIMKSEGSDWENVIAPVSLATVEEDQEVVNSVCQFDPFRKNSESSWPKVKANSAFIHPGKLRDNQFSDFEYEDIFDYVLGILEDTDAINFVESLYDFWVERGHLSERQHTSLMSFYNRLKRRYG